MCNVNCGCRRWKGTVWYDRLLGWWAVNEVVPSAGDVRRQGMTDRQAGNCSDKRQADSSAANTQGK